MTKEELLKLAEDRPLITSEKYEPNDFYGTATIIKQYVGASPDYAIKAAIEHGPVITDYIWDVDINVELPAIISTSRYRSSVLREHTSKALFSIGPYLAYAPHYMDHQTMEKEKKRLGKMLLAFHGHSSSYIDVHFDINEYCQKLAEVAKDFDSVCICLYWKDISRGFADIFMSYGFECVTAGHIYDPLFMPRLKSIIELATITTSNEYGTYLCYSVYMGKPFWFIKSGKITYKKLMDVPRDDSHINHPNTLELERVFSVQHRDISSYQKDLVDKYSGLSEIKSVEEMRFIINKTEVIYNKIDIRLKRIFNHYFKKTPIRLLKNN
jgi:hypothetical protein